MSIEFTSKENDINEISSILHEENANNFEILLENINKQIEFLKEKYNVMDLHGKIIEIEKNEYYKNIEKVQNNKELSGIKIEEK